MINRYKSQDPIVLAGTYAAAGIILHLMVFLIGSHPYRAWVASASMVLIYAVFISIILLRVSDTRRYVTRAMYGFLIVLPVMMGMAYAFSLGDLTGLEKIKPIMVVICIVFTIMLAITYVMRKFIDYAQRQQDED